MKEHAKDASPIFFYLKWASTIALGVIGTAGVAVLLLLFFVTADRGTEYTRLIASHRLTQESLLPAIVVFGLTVLVLATVITWLVSLSASFRIAGPVYRFSENFKHALEHPWAPHIGIRRTDLLHAEWRASHASMIGLRNHYAALHDAVRESKQARLKADAGNVEPMLIAVNALLELERRVRL